MTELLHQARFWLIPVNLIAFVLMGADKYRAKAGARRIPERTLLLFALAGGTPGAILGMELFRHKTRRAKFAAGLPLLLCAQIALLWLAAGRPGL